MWSQQVCFSVRVCVQVSRYCRTLACFCSYNLACPVWCVPFSLTHIHTLHYLDTNRNVNYKECHELDYKKERKKRLAEQNTCGFMNGSLSCIPFINPNECMCCVCLWANCVCPGCQAAARSSAVLWMKIALCCSFSSVYTRCQLVVSHAETRSKVQVAISFLLKCSNASAPGKYLHTSTIAVASLIACPVDWSQPKHTERKRMFLQLVKCYQRLSEHIKALLRQK